MFLVTTHGLLSLHCNKIQTNFKKTTSNRGIPSFELQKHYHQLSFSEAYGPNEQAQNLNDIMGKKTKKPLLHLKVFWDNLIFQEIMMLHVHNLNHIQFTI